MKILVDDVTVPEKKDKPVNASNNMIIGVVIVIVVLAILFALYNLQQNKDANR